MWAAGFAVAAEESVVAGINIDKRDRVIFAEMLQKRREFLELLAFAGVHEQSGASEVAFVGGVKFGEDGD